LTRAKFSIFHKGLLLIGGPLIFQLVFIVLFLVMQTKERLAEGWLLHTKDVIAQAELCFRTVSVDFSDTRGAVLAGSVPAKSVGYSKEALDQIDQLQQFVIDNPEQVKNTQTFRTASRDLLKWVAHVDDLLRQGHKDQATDEISHATALDLLNTLRGDLDAILSHERNLAEMRHEQLTRTRMHIRWILGVFAGTSAFLAILALGIFSQNIGRRMGRLAGNAEALGERRPLGPLLHGSDEISVVDRAFHHAADQLNQAMESETRYRTEIERRVEELARLNKDLAFKTQENETFVYSVSHDLRSPLVNLQGFSQELAHSCEQLSELVTNDSIPEVTQQKLHQVIDKDMQISVRFIHTAVSRASNIIDALLRLSRAGRVEYSLKNVAVRPIVERVVEAMQGSIRQRGAEIVIKDLPDARGDATAIEQIFGNLVGNAVNYLDPKRPGRIEIGAQSATDDGEIGRPMNVYYVKDNGSGIAAAYLPKMFVAFQRLHGALAAGEGIGLAMARRMVERHGGNIWVESQENTGTTFFVALPPAEAQGQPDGAPVNGEI
jgi:signal transduction histidine kinase